MQNAIGLRELRNPSYGRNAISIKHFVRPPNSHGIGLHWHERVEVLRVRSGSMTVTLRGNQDYLVEEGSMIFIAPMVLHESLNGPLGVDYDVVMFEASRFQNGVSAVTEMLQLLMDQRLSFDAVTSEPEVIRIVDAIVALPAAQVLEGVALVYALFGALNRFCHPVQTELLPADERFSQVIAYINEFWFMPMSAKTLSEHFNYTEPYFCRRFKQTTGVTLGQYVEALRLEQSRSLLRHTDAPVHQIAMQCGFCDISYFAARFKKRHGISPIQYRKEQHRQRD